jgi:hypothetical protein
MRIRNTGRYLSLTSGSRCDDKYPGLILHCEKFIGTKKEGKKIKTRGRTLFIKITSREGSHPGGAMLVVFCAFIEPNFPACHTVMFLVVT